MKNTKLLIILFLYILAGTNVFGQTKNATAEVIVKEALAEAAKTHKNVFIIFHASWCGWCHKMDAAMNDGKLKSFFVNNYVVVHLTVDESKDKKELENPGAVELLKKYHGDQQGIPYWFILDAKGNLASPTSARRRRDIRAARHARSPAGCGPGSCNRPSPAPRRCATGCAAAAGCRASGIRASSSSARRPPPSCWARPSGRAVSCGAR